MKDLIKKIFKSPIFRLVISIVLIYFAFKKVDISNLGRQLMGIDLWFIVVNVIFGLIFLLIMSYRWSLLLIKKPKIKDVFVFGKSSLMASFYGLFLPTIVGIDLLRWMMIHKKYPKISKSKLLGSIMLDRFIGLSTYMIIGLAFIFLAKSKGIDIPNLILLLVTGIVILCLAFYIFIVFFNVDKLFKIKFFKRFSKIAELVKKDNLKQIFKGIGMSLFTEAGWVLQIWFISWYFGANLSVLYILIFIPIISLILVLPISIAGFGAREQLYLFFFSQIGASSESILLTSAFTGILVIIISLIGGLVTLSSDFRKLKQKNKKE